MTHAPATTRASSRRPGAGGVRAFTLVELLIVISIIAIALVAILPAFSKVLESNNYASAVNAVTATLQRAAASGKEGGVVFLFDPQREAYTLQQVEVYNPDATLYDGATQGYNGPRIPAVAYRPAAGQAPVALPKGMGVYGMSFAHEDYSVANPPAPTRWYDSEAQFYPTTGQNAGRIQVNSWLFPRSHIQFFLEDYNPDNPADIRRPGVAQGATPGDAFGAQRFHYTQSFFVRFTATGEPLGSAGVGGRPKDAYLEFPGLPTADLPPNVTLTPGERDDRFDPQAFFPGDASRPAVFNPEVRLRAVDQIAVVDLGALSRGAGVDKPWYLRSSSAPVANLPSTPQDKAKYRVSADPATNSEIVRVNRWIDENGQIIGFGRYAGQVVKR